MSLKYETVNDYLDEIESFALRRERIPEEAIPWVIAAFEAARLEKEEVGMSFTAEQLIKRHLFLVALNDCDTDELQWEGDVTPDNVDEAWDMLVGIDAHYDYLSDFRSSGVETDIECDDSRHYESVSVARQLPCGTWVGWTYWHGGGKYGEPSMVPWLEDSYLLDVTEEEKVVTVRTFKKVGE